MTKPMNIRPLLILLLACAALISGAACAQSEQTITIVAPQPETTIHDNNGNLTVTVAVSPPPHLEAGERLTLLLDGTAVAGGARQRFELENIDRGSHTLQAQVNAADGSVIAASAPVTFYMWRASRLFPNRTKQQ